MTRSESRLALVVFVMTMLATMFLAAPVVGQTVDVVSPPWRLYLEETDSTISFHNEIENAIEAASEYASAHPDRGGFLMMPSAPWRVTFNWPTIDAPPPDTVRVPGDTVFIREDTVRVVITWPGNG